MRIPSPLFFQLLLATAASTQLVVLPIELPDAAPDAAPDTNANPFRQARLLQQQQQPLVDDMATAASPSSSQPEQQQQQSPPDMQPQMQQDSVVLSDVMGRDRSINVFASYARDSAALSARLDDRARNSTVLAPLNSAIDALPRKPWEDPRDYDGPLGAHAYDGDDGRDRAARNLRRFVDAHVVPLSPWPRGEAAAAPTLLDGDRRVWWETRQDGVRVIQPDNIEVASIASRVGNGEVWILKGVRNYA